MTHKICPKCKLPQLLEEFRNHSYCRTCNSARVKAHYWANVDAKRKTAREAHQQNPAHYREKARVWRQSKKKECPEYFLWRSARRRAAERDIPFTLDVEDIIIPERCPVLGLRLSTQTKKGFIDNAATLDRFVPQLGYTKENTRVISWRANTIKRDATLGELEAVLAYMKS